MTHVLFPGWGRIALLTGGGRNRIKVHDEALAVEVSNVVAGDFDGIVGIVFRLQIEREGGATFYAGDLAQIVDLDEIIGISGFLGSTFEVELADNMDFHSFSPLPFWFCISPGNAERLWGSGEAGCSLVSINAPNSPNIKLAIVFLDIMAEKYYCKYY